MTQDRQTIRVMLVDDHRTLLWGLERLIEGQRPLMEVIGVAESCHEAVANVERLMPDVVLLDLDLGGRSSLEVLPMLLRGGKTRVLVLTACCDQPMLDAAVVRGARGILYKGVATDQVLKAVQKVHAGELWLDHDRLSRVIGGVIGPKMSSASDPEALKLSSLTERERKIVRTVVRESGAQNKVIAARLFISEHTLRNHLSSIYQKLGVANRLELYVFAARHYEADVDSAGQKPPNRLAASYGRAAREG